MLGDTAVAVHPGRRALQAPDRQARAMLPLVDRLIPDRRRRICRSGEGHRRGEDHAGARLQRFRGRPAARAADDQRARRRGAHDDKAHSGQLPAATRRDSSSMASIASRRASDRRAAGGAAACSRRSSRTRTCVPYGDRSGVVIEPCLTDQWYVDAKTLARAGDRRGARAARRRSCRRTGRRPISTGWTTSSPGASRGQLVVGASDPGLVRRRTARSSSRPKRRRRRAHDGRRTRRPLRRARRVRSRRATRTCSTPGSPRRCGRSRRSAGRTRRRSSRATTRPTCWSPASTSSSSGSPG